MTPPDTSPRVLSFADAMRLVLSHATGAARPPDRFESVSLLASQGRVLAAPIVADRAQPPFNRSARDGFAARASGWAAGSWLRIAGQVRAGQDGGAAPIHPGDAVEIMTGAPVPGGADCVVMVEHAIAQQGRVRLAEGRVAQSGENIVPEGAEARLGEALVAAGTRMAAAEIAAAASAGCASPLVFARPRVAIIPTGDELVELDQPPLPHQIRNSNSYALAAQVAAAGGEPVRLPIAGDSLEVLLGAIRSARGCDLMLLSGGVSMGKYDLVEEALVSLGADFFFTGVRMQPGKPVVFGRLPASPDHAALYFFGLPGNPVSTQVTFRLFARPLLEALCGAAVLPPPFVQATLSMPVQAKPGLTRFLPGFINHDLLRPAVSLVQWQGSGDQAAHARANCYLVIPPDAEQIAPGSIVTVLLR